MPYESESESDSSSNDEIIISRINTDNVDIKKIGNAMMKIFFSVMNSRKEITQQPDEPVEGTLEEAKPGEIKKLTVDEYYVRSDSVKQK